MLKYPNVLDGTIKLHTFARLLNTSNKQHFLFGVEENAFTFYIVLGDRQRIFSKETMKLTCDFVYEFSISFSYSQLCIL